MKIGYVIPHHEIGADPSDLKALAQGAEAMGADHLLLYDHVLGADRNRPGGFEGPYDKDVRFHEPLTAFAYLAGVTETIGLMTAVLILPQRQTALVAKQAAEVAILSNNRLRLGIGTGWNKVEYDALGENFHNRGVRQSEQVELMRSLWRDDVLDYSGKHHRVELASINPRPTETIPVWFGGGAPKLLERCARLGDGWVPITGPNDTAKAALATMQEVRESAGLSWEGFGIQAQAQFGGGTPERWKTHAERWKALGCTHMAIATHNAGIDSVQGHLDALASYQQAVADIA